MKLVHILQEGSKHTTYAAWALECKRAHHGCMLTGDQSVSAATHSGRTVGEWNGFNGEVFSSPQDVKPRNQVKIDELDS